MATSGSFDWTMTRDQLIEDALQDIGALGQGQTASAAQVSEASTVLNRIVKNWQAEGIRLWTIDWKTKTFTASSVVTNGGDTYTCIRSHTSSASNEPGVGADWTTYWKKTGTGGSAWATSTSYSAIGDFTVDSDTIGIDRAFIRYNNVDYPVEIIGRDEYASIPDKSATGRPTKLWFEMKLDGSSVVYLYPQPDKTDYVLHYFRVRKLEDFDNSGDTPDFPERWIAPLQAELAYRLSFKYGLPLAERQLLRADAEMLKKRAKATDDEVRDSDFVSSAYPWKG